MKVFSDRVMGRTGDVVSITLTKGTYFLNSLFHCKVVPLGCADDVEGCDGSVCWLGGGKPEIKCPILAQVQQNKPEAKVSEYAVNCGLK
ncbi:hypothetical protein JYU34_000526 [Plutella xylostella]|uniref:Uncharacterized protein n=1 Tax=Plutella xylostella TaxID=51655 RepID=A0ABQ7R860_PLUXY|nr:hypothetical protein JYU34_000526 [Plutella xylostella]